MKAILKPEIYYDRVADTYDALYKDGISIIENEIIKKLLIETISPLNSKEILDLGCGTGLGLEFIQNSGITDYSYTGIDISSQMIHNSNRRFDNNAAYSFYVDDMTNLSRFEDNSFSAVISLFGSFSHVIDYKKGLSEIYRVLKPGGKIFLMTYSQHSISAMLMSIVNLNCEFLKFRRLYDIRNNNSKIACEALFYSPKILNAILYNLGFKNLNYKGLNYLLELGLFKKNIGKHPKITVKWFDVEKKLFSKYPQLAHSLITIGEK